MGELHQEVINLWVVLQRAAAEQENFKAQHGSRFAEMQDDIKSVRKGLMASRADLQQAVHTISVIRNENEILKSKLAESQATSQGAPEEFRGFVAKAASADKMISHLQSELARSVSTASGADGSGQGGLTGSPRKPKLSQNSSSTAP